MNWLFDQPYTIAIVGVAIVFFLGIAWVQTGRNAFLYAVAGVMALAALLLVLERRIITDREAVETRLYAFAAAVESNNSSNLADCIVRSRPELLAAARGEMAHHKFTEARVTKIHHVEVLPKHQPPQVTVEFNGTVSGSFKIGRASCRERV